MFVQLEAQKVVHGRPSNRGAGDGRLSPNSLANKFSASLNYLEGMEESLRQVVGMERTRGIALAQQESVSLAQVLKVSLAQVDFAAVAINTLKKTVHLSGVTATSLPLSFALHLGQTTGAQC